MTDPETASSLGLQGGVSYRHDSGPPRSSRREEREELRTLRNRSRSGPRPSRNGSQARPGGFAIAVTGAGTAFVLMAIYGVVTFSSYPALATMVLGSSTDGWIAAAMTLPAAILLLAVFVALLGPSPPEDHGAAFGPSSERGDGTGSS